MLALIDNTLLTFHIFPGSNSGISHTFVLAAFNSVIRLGAIYVFIRVALTAFIQGSFV